MNVRRIRFRPGTATTAVLAALAVGVLAVGASPASAAASNGYVSGAGAATDDWADEGPLSSSSYRSSNAACLWQEILFAEGAVESDGTRFDEADIDGVFGPNTTYATKKLQGRWGLAADGVVGRQTFGKADGKLKFKSGSTASGQYLFLTYDGAVHDINTHRKPNGRYTVYEGGGWYEASYTSRNCR